MEFLLKLARKSYGTLNNYQLDLNHRPPSIQPTLSPHLLSWPTKKSTSSPSAVEHLPAEILLFATRRRSI